MFHSLAEERKKEKVKSKKWPKDFRNLFFQNAYDAEQHKLFSNFKP
jgi:hypothetical protein